MQTHRSKSLICLFLGVTILAVYWQLLSHDFINFDTSLHVTENPHVQAGLTKNTIIWAFTSFHANFWIPLTWLSHMLDCQLFGLNPGMHHLTNLLFHLANSVLLFLLLERMTGSVWRSALVAALFALHPLRVESVAWVAERKDVLSTLFWLLTMWTYVLYAAKPRLRHYVLAMLFFSLGLMAKPMLVTLPFVLLLLDFWPLARLRVGKLSQESNPNIPQSSLGRLVLEKVPFLVLAVTSSVVTLLAKQRGDALKLVEMIPLKIRISNALISYLAYIGKMIWPHNLAVFYPYPSTISVWKVIGATVFLTCLTIFLIRAAQRFPYLVVGWLWYLGTLVPVIGLVQVGSQAMADRFTYIPLIGLFIMIAWGVPELLGGWRYRRLVYALSTSILLLILITSTYLQVRYWKNSIVLFTHAVKVTSNNWLAHNNLGVALYRQGRPQEAIGHYSEALRIQPDHAGAHYNLGIVLAEQARLDEAIVHYSEALRIKPGHANTHNNLGLALFRKGKFEEAIGQYSEALQINPEHAGAHHNLGILLAQQGRFDEAMVHYSETLRVKPDHADAHNNLGVALARQGRLEEAVRHFSEAVRINPDASAAHRNLEMGLRLMGKFPLNENTGERP